MSDILIIDDNRNLLEVISELFTKEGMSCVTASDGEHAVAVLKEQINSGQAPPICLLDVVMPGLSGVPLMRRLRSISNEIRFMIMTAYNDLSQIEEMQQEGVVETFFKPFRIEEIIAKSSFILSNTRRIPVK